MNINSVLETDPDKIPHDFPPTSLRQISLFLEPKKWHKLRNYEANRVSSSK